MQGWSGWRVVAVSCLALAGCSTTPPTTPKPTEILPAFGCPILATEAPNSTFVLLNPATGRWSGCGIERAKRRFLPASTFKVPHALIALETGVVDDPEATEPWDGLERRVRAWNQDTSLATGMENSTVWFYQGTAGRIGHERMAAWIARFDYGNAQIGSIGDLTSFWLAGDLRASAVEQVIFLDRLRRQALPASTRNQEQIAKIMHRDGAKRWSLYAKSGAVLPIDPSTGDISNSASLTSSLKDSDRIGWFVGWVARPEEAGGDRVFALNLQLNSMADLNKRELMARAMLAANGVPLRN